eukprot:7597098-Pyramimonas_sp.AAC.1
MREGSSAGLSSDITQRTEAPTPAAKQLAPHCPHTRFIPLTDDLPLLIISATDVASTTKNRRRP